MRVRHVETHTSAAEPLSIAASGMGVGSGQPVATVRTTAEESLFRGVFEDYRNAFEVCLAR